MIASETPELKHPNHWGRKYVAGAVTTSLLVALGLGVAPASFAAPPSGNASLVGVLGARPGATRLPVQISDQVSGSIDVGTGNFLLNINALSLPGINSNMSLGAAFNSLSTITTPGLVAPRWTMSLGSAGSLSTVTGGIIVTAGDGNSSLFTPVTGSSTAYTPPAGVKADLIKTGTTGWTLFSRTTAEVVTFNSEGQPTKVADRNANNTTLTWSSAKPTQIVSSRGIAGARTATIAYTSTGLLDRYSQTSAGATRNASFARDTSGNLTGFTDLAGKTTTFTYTAGRVNTVTTPSSGITTISYDTTGRVTKVEKTNNTAGSPGNSITRISYPTATQTLIAGPNTNPAVAVATGPHTTYTLESSKRVTAATDPIGRSQAKTYTADFDTLTATRGTGITAGTTTNTYAANSGQSLTQSQAPTGAKAQLAYTNTADATKYLPTSTTSDAGNQSLVSYNGAGNALTSSDALAATATLTYNPDGTVATALTPGNGTNKTAYTYNVNHELTTITPVTGTSLAASTLTYDEWGRPRTVTSAPGVTATYSHDAIGRVTQTAFSDSTPAMTYTYNDDGQLTTRLDSSGSTTYGYDQMGRLISRGNTAGGGTINYGYDKASNLASTTDTRGTTSYTYDDAGTLTTLVYLLNGVPKTLAFATDNQGRRTDTWLESNAAHTSWKAHTHTDYDNTGRVSRVTAAQGTGDTSNTLTQDLSYCHAADTTPFAGTTAPPCTTTPANDRQNIQWLKDNRSGAVTSYTYDGANRLTKAFFDSASHIFGTDTTYHYGYDSRSNRTTKNVDRLSTSVSSAQFNAANQITVSYNSSTYNTYDASGNLTQDPEGIYSYNAAQQMTTATKGGTTYTYTYAGASNNELVAQTTPQGTYQYTYGRTDSNGLPIIEQIKNDGNTAYVEHDPVTGEPLLLRTSDGMQSLYVNDGNGNLPYLISSTPSTAANYTYQPYGASNHYNDSNPLVISQNPYTFKQGLNDRTTGWIKYGARYYNPIDAHWTQQDSLDTPLNPTNANRYAYAANNPINLTDPTGMDTDGCVVGWIGLGSSVVGLIGAAATTPVTGPVGFWAIFGIVSAIVGGASGGAAVATEC